MGKTLALKWTLEIISWMIKLRLEKAARRRSRTRTRLPALRLLMHMWPTLLHFPLSPWPHAGHQ